jgi:transcription termination factor Rho
MGQGQGYNQNQNRNRNQNQNQRRYRPQPRVPQKPKRASVFETLEAIQPHQRLRLETTGTELSMRVMDLITPIGKGQRGLIVAPPRTGKTMLLQKIGLAINKNHPDVKIMILLVDERPEEVSDFKMMFRETPVEIYASNNDMTPVDHIAVTEDVLDKAKAIAEEGGHSMILFDSLTRMTRAYNHQTRGQGRTLSGGIDAAAFQGPRSFFGAARQLDKAGSLTILGTVLVDTGSRMDQVIFEEFKGTGNMELHLDRELADRRLFPSFDLIRSGTRREEKLLDENELDLVWRLRRTLADRRPIEGMTALLEQMKKTKSNAEFLKLIG